MENENEIITFNTFYLGQKLFGIDILDIKEINDEINFTSIDHAPDEIRGYVNIRGSLYLIADIATLLNFKATETTNNSKLLIVKNHIAGEFGIIVDEIGDTITVKQGDIFDRRSSDSESFSNSNYERRATDKDISNGVVKLKDSLMITINAKNIIQKLIDKN